MKKITGIFLVLPLSFFSRAGVVTKTDAYSPLWVITTGIFTQDSIDETQVLVVELWNGKRLLQELYTHGYFSPPDLG